MYLSYLPEAKTKVQLSLLNRASEAAREVSLKFQ